MIIQTGWRMDYIFRIPKIMSDMVSISSSLPECLLISSEMRNQSIGGILSTFSEMTAMTKGLVEAVIFWLIF